MVILGRMRGREDFIVVVAEASGLVELDSTGIVLIVGAAVRVRNGGRIALIRDVVEANTRGKKKISLHTFLNIETN